MFPSISVLPSVSTRWPVTVILVIEVTKNETMRSC